MDKHHATWVLEFLLRQPVDDWAVHKILLTHPPLNTNRLKKTILLRRIISDLVACSLSQRTLHSLELIEELDQHEGEQPLESMKLAYCAVAVQLTLNCARTNNKEEFEKAYCNIWVNKVADLERHEVGGLLSKQLKEWRDKLEIARRYRYILAQYLEWDTKREALESLRVYVKDAMEEMGPSFLERAAEVFGERGMNLQDHHTNRSKMGIIGDRPPDGATSSRSPSIEGTNTGTVRNKDSNPSYSEGLEGSQIQVDANASTEKGSKVAHIGGTSIEGTSTGIVQNEDQNPSYIDGLEGNQSRVDVSASTEKGAGVTHTEGSSIVMEMNEGPEAVAHHNLTNENPTARTYELDEDSSASGKSSSPAERPLPSPKRRTVSPLKIPNDKNIGKKRKYDKWTLLEEDKLREAVKKHGEGNWKLIQSCYSEVFKGRTAVNLKDKWRNMIGGT